MDFTTQIVSAAGSKQSSKPCYTKRKASWIQWPNKPINSQPNDDHPCTKMETPDHDIPWPFFARD